jgi:hypothetical protein
MAKLGKEERQKDATGLGELGCDDAALQLLKTQAVPCLSTTKTRLILLATHRVAEARIRP